MDFRDYLRAKLSSLDVLTFQGTGSCKMVEYIDIRGHKGYDVTVPFWQTSYATLHTDTDAVHGCQFNGKAGSVHSEDNFGFYGSGLNPKFRGSENDDSTTEYWFGGYL